MYIRSMKYNTFETSETRNQKPLARALSHSLVESFD